MTLPAKLLLSPLLVAQALLTRARLPRLPEADGARSGRIGSTTLALRLLILGDSSAAGVGVREQAQALAGHLTQALSRRTQQGVQWRLVARSGVTSAQCLALLDALAGERFDLAVVVLGVNDVIDQVPSHTAVAARAAIANRLRNAHGVAHVVFALPPIHQFPGLPQPLRWVMGHDARRHDAATARWAATRADVSHVPIDVPLNSGVMACDGVHPGEPVYRVCGVALAEHIAERVLPRG